MQITPACLTQAVDRETAGAKILWAGQPTPKNYVRNSWKDALIGIPFTAFSIFWTWGVSGGLNHDKQSSPPLFFMLWGSMFIFIGLCILLSPFVNMWKATRTYYVVTEHRAIIFEKFWSVKIQSFSAASLQGFERVSHGHDTGDIIFRRIIERRGKNTRTTLVGFIGVDNFTRAEHALDQMQTHKSKLA